MVGHNLISFFTKIHLAVVWVLEKQERKQNTIIIGAGNGGGLNCMGPGLDTSK